MGCDRDRALLEFYVSSGARASELLGVTLEDIDWAGQLLYVVSKGQPAAPAGAGIAGRFPLPGAAIWPPTACHPQGNLYGGLGVASPAR